MYVYLAVALLSAAFSAFGAWQVQDWRYGAKEADRIEQAREDRNLREKTIDSAAAGHERDKAAIRTDFVVITERVNETLKADFYADGGPGCMDDSGLRDLNAARGIPAPGPEPAPAVPEPAARHWWQPRGEPARPNP